MFETPDSKFASLVRRLTLCLLLALVPQITLAGNWGQGKWGTMVWGTGTGSEEEGCFTSSAEPYVQKIFVAYLGRPAAPRGLRYYADYLAADNEGGKRILFDDLYYSAEAEALYKNMTLSQRINQFYQNMFNRDALSGGLNYWIGQINGGFVTIPESAAQIADAASGEGMAKLDAKQVAASKLTCAIGDDAAKLSAFQANAAGARASIAAVTTAEQAGAYDGEAELARITGSAKAMAVKRPDSAQQRSVSERPSGEAEPIPAIPALGFLILSCFASLVGLRRLAYR